MYDTYKMEILKSITKEEKEKIQEKKDFSLIFIFHSMESILHSMETIIIYIIINIIRKN